MNIGQLDQMVARGFYNGDPVDDPAQYRAALERDERRFVADLTQAFVDAGYWYDDACKAVAWCTARAKAPHPQALVSGMRLVCCYAARLLAGLERMK